jgi:hypothetical protein
MTSSKKEPKSPGTVQGEKTRSKCNNLTDTEREHLLNRAMSIIYQDVGKSPVRAHRR